MPYNQYSRIAIISVCVISFLLVIYNYEKITDYKIVFIQRGTSGQYITNETYTKVLNFYYEVKLSEKKVFSQLRQDGVLEFLTNFIGLTKTGTFVEFGVQNGVECTTRNLRQNRNWTGIMFDGGYANKTIGLYKEIIHARTIVNLFRNYSIPKEFDLLVEDTDYADYWIVRSILQHFKPKLVVHEVNQQRPDRCVSVPYSDNLLWWRRYESFHGGSVYAFYCLAKSFGYTMVYCESYGVDCFWVRNDVLEKSLNINVEQIQFVIKPKLLFSSHRPGYGDRPNANWTHFPPCLG